MQEAAPQAEAMNFTILGTVLVHDIELTSVKDIALNQVLLAVSHINPKGSKPHKILQGLGYSPDTLMKAFHEVALQIEAFTGNIHPSR